MELLNPVVLTVTDVEVEAVTDAYVSRLGVIDAYPTAMVATVRCSDGRSALEFECRSDCAPKVGDRLRVTVEPE